MKFSQIRRKWISLTKTCELKHILTETTFLGPNRNFWKSEARWQNLFLNCCHRTISCMLKLNYLNVFIPSTISFWVFALLPSTALGDKDSVVQWRLLGLRNIYLDLKNCQRMSCVLDSCVFLVIPGKLY